MATLTERIRFTVPKAVKDDWKREAAARGISLSAFLRGAIDDSMAIEELTEAWRMLEAERGLAVP